MKFGEYKELDLPTITTNNEIYRKNVKRVLDTAKARVLEEKVDLVEFVHFISSTGYTVEEGTESLYGELNKHFITQTAAEHKFVEAPYKPCVYKIFEEIERILLGGEYVSPEALWYFIKLRKYGWKRQ